MSPITPNPDPDSDGRALGRHLLVLAPFGRDAVEIRRVLSTADIDARCCADVDAVCREIDRDAFAVLLAEEALNDRGRARLSTVLDGQPTWSDFPVLMMISRSRNGRNEWHALRGIKGTAYLTLLERPLQVVTLVSSVRTAMQARERQYQIRDALAARACVEDELRKLNRTLEARVHERTADLEVRNRDLQSFAYVASHDLREPLRKIQTFAELVAEEDGQTLGEDARNFLKRMAAAAVRMDRLLHDLLVFSRVGLRADSNTPVHVGDVVEEVLKDFELMIEDTHAEIDVDANVTIEADPPQLRQLITNLIGNALKFRRSQSAPRLRIRAAAINESEPAFAAVSYPACKITVEDDGIGFDAKYADRIFEPFERLHGQGTYEGTGMGLAICKRIVQAHGGGIRAESTQGEGSRFVVVLPAYSRTGGGDAEGL
jgi:signal transduction histidine kinase